jgi:hypothetical protein
VEDIRSPTSLPFLTCSVRYPTQAQNLCKKISCATGATAETERTSGQRPYPPDKVTGVRAVRVLCTDNRNLTARLGLTQIAVCLSHQFPLFGLIRRGTCARVDFVRLVPELEDRTHEKSYRRNASPLL